MGIKIFNLKYKDEVTKYLMDKGYVDTPFIIEDISTGNMNYVYRVKELATDRTYILKYAAEHTRISEDIMVSTERINIEARALIEFNQYVPQYVPKVYHYDNNNNCIIMKDCSEYSILRDKLNQFEIIPEFANNITSYLVMSIMPTLNIVENEERNKVIQNINNPLCETTKAFVFSEPFNKCSNTNDIFELSREFIDLEVFQNKKLLYQVDKLKQQFMSKNQALIHGDLHTGSIFVNKSSIILFDYEFAFYGPIGFDIGNLMANLIFSWLHAKVLGPKSEFMYWIENMITEMIDKFKDNYVSEFTTRFNTKAKYSSEYIAASVEDIIHDTAAFAGVEIIRRIIGIAHVSDIISIDKPEKRAEAEKLAIKLGKIFILNRKQFNCGADFMKELI